MISRTPNAGEIKGVVVGTGKGSTNLITVKPEGRNELPARLINGLRLGAEARLGNERIRR